MTIKNKLYFVYSRRLADFLVRDRGLEFVTYAKHPQTGRLFWIFERGSQLQAGLDDYKRQHSD